ncbi:MAG: Fic family protein [Planctomycetia bacterium]|nr:Fic family protein [Planctomycetia bacterium]
MIPDERPFYPPFTIVTPPFDSQLTQRIMDLDYLRRKKEWSGSTPADFFEQIRSVFFMLESISSARIEGNRTTIAEYLQNRTEPSEERPGSFQEIANLEGALSFVEETARDIPINAAYIRELHKRSVAGLRVSEEGDPHPGEFRREKVAIRHSSHRPPRAGDVPALVEEMVSVLATPTSPRYDLLKMALSHHRFVWIHPFANGNGRTARLFTYALLVKYGFALENSRIANPASVFCASRKRYYDGLSLADRALEENQEQGLLDWCEYVLENLQKEIEKVESLTDWTFFSQKIMLPAIQWCRQYDKITPDEAKVLQNLFQKPEIKAEDVRRILQKSDRTGTRILTSLREKKIVQTIGEKGRKYRIHLTGGLLGGIVSSLIQERFFTDTLAEETS